jgi:hypothetical protein
MGPGRSLAGCRPPRLTLRNAGAEELPAQPVQAADASISDLLAASVLLALRHAR